MTRNLVEEARGLMAPLKGAEPWPDGMVQVQVGDWIYVLQFNEGEVVGCVTVDTAGRKLMGQWLQTTGPIQATEG